MSAPTVEKTVTSQRRGIAVGKKRGGGSFVWSYPMTQADIDAHAAASHVRPSAMTEQEREDLSKKVSEVNKRSSGR
ncbi:hypothetical protein ACGFMM_01495 [Streptomyces sp. NPDC048604]|uniref:hypothetical protein n=1 Tax=Streptomyces sp. NPDC048604 TaxID=3365578 RepID=UPI0037192E76